MNRGVLESSPVQQMMANPNWWNINSMRPPAGPPFMGQPQVVSPFLPPPHPSQPNLFPQYLPSPTSSSSSSSPSLSNPNSWHDHHHHQHHHNQDPPEAWSLSQLLMGGLMVGEDEKGAMARNFQVKRLENWEEQVLNHHQNQASHVGHVDVKQETSPNSYSNIYGVHHGSSGQQDFHHASALKPAAWSPHHHHQHQVQVMPNSPTNKSCVTTSLSNNSNMLDFSSNYHNSSCTSNKLDQRHPPPDRSSETNGTETTGSVKKARVQPSSTQSTLKVRKEKLGGRIAALHQLVSPFGKTDTASVLSEAIGYIRFLQSQIEALSLPYLGAGSGRHQQPVQGERNCIFTEEPDQDSCQELKKDLRSRGLCLVPISCTLQMGSDNGADYWAPAFGTGFR